MNLEKCYLDLLNYHYLQGDFEDLDVFTSIAA